MVIFFTIKLMKQIPSSEYNSSSANQEIPAFYGTQDCFTVCTRTAGHCHEVDELIVHTSPQFYTRSLYLKCHRMTQEFSIGNVPAIMGILQDEILSQVL
jgi:hypothetical protein